MAESASAIVVGFVGAGLGLGEAARGIADALVAVGCEVSVHEVPVPSRVEGGADPGPAGRSELARVDADATADLVVVCANPPELEAWRQEGRRLPAGRTNVGVWAWEVDPVPDSWPALAARFDELWVYSEFVRCLVEPTVAIPVRVVPPPVRLPQPAGRGSHLLAADRPTLVTLLDGASTIRRKNPIGAIEAFRRATRPGEARLVVKAWNTDLGFHEVDTLRLRAAAKACRDVILVESWLDRADLVDLLAGAAGLVALHRAEGHGLAIFEALALGVPVIATAASGSIDLLGDDMATLVPATPALVGPGADPYPATATWFEPDLVVAAAQIRAMLDDPAGARAAAARGQARVTACLSVDAVGRRLRPVVAAAVEASRDRAPRRPLRPRVSVVSHARDPWPALRPLLEATPLDGAVELIVAASAPEVLPDEERPTGVRRLDEGSRSPFELRAAGLRQADGDLIVVTEDHCVPAPGWLAAYLEAMELGAGPVLAGPVDNAPDSTRVEWANYLMTFGPFASPLAELPADRAPTAANVALRAEVLDELKDLPGDLERRLIPELWAAGQVSAVPGAAVRHVQPSRAVVHLVRHLHDARCLGAFQRAAGSPRPSLSPRAVRDEARMLLRSVSSGVADRPHLHRHHQEAGAWLRAIALVRVVARAVGHRRGAGRSAQHLD